jgi:hypothetical protein
MLPHASLIAAAAAGCGDGQGGPGDGQGDPYPAWSTAPPLSGLPLPAVVCPKCRHHEAYFQEIQTRSADEPATVFNRCASCTHIWKEG